MTEAQAWREIARRIVEGEWHKKGLCYEAWRLLREDQVCPSTEGVMFQRANLHVQELIGVSDTRILAFAYPPGSEPEARALAALWMALESKE